MRMQNLTMDFAHYFLIKSVNLESIVTNKASLPGTVSVPIAERGIRNCILSWRKFLKQCMINKKSEDLMQSCKPPKINVRNCTTFQKCNVAFTFKLISGYTEHDFTLKRIFFDVALRSTSFFWLRIKDSMSLTM